VVVLGLVRLLPPQNQTFLLGNTSRMNLHDTLGTLCCVFCTTLYLQLQPPNQDPDKAGVNNFQSFIILQSTKVTDSFIFTCMSRERENSFMCSS
jgi:hypothetical protein